MSIHLKYIAIIIVLILVIVYASAKSIRANNILKEVQERFGLNETLRASFPRPGGKWLRKHNSAALLKPRTFQQWRQEVDSIIERAQKMGEFGKETKLSEACAHALTGGKRLRAIILLEIVRAFSVRKMENYRKEMGDPPTPVDASEVALFIEYLHSASLVIDDLPMFDNDSIRRGNASLHTAVGPAVAQLAALSLVSAAVQNVCRQLDWLRDYCPEIKNVDRIGTRICSDVSQALGSMGAAGGQYMDISSVETLMAEHGPDAVAELMYLKTATFFEIATVTGWLVAGGSSDQLSIMRNIGHHIGVAFQIADDIGDMKSDAERAAQGKAGWNFANVYTQPVAHAEVERNLNGARLMLNQMRLWTPLWDEIYDQIRSMMNVSS